MKVLMLVNWKVNYSDTIPNNLQPPDYYISGESYWFFKHWPEDVEVDVIDIGSSWFTNKVEKKVLKFYILQAIRALPIMKHYDVVISHGVQSGIFLSLIRRMFKIKNPKHIVFEIGGFNSARETGLINRFMRIASKSIDGLIYHTSSQLEYYKKCFPWLVEKSKFLHFGTDPDYFQAKCDLDEKKYILCVGYAKRDWATLISAFEKLNRKDVYLKIIGKKDLNITNKNIILQGFIPIKELIEEIKNSMFVVVPLECFNYSYGQMTLLQAMALSKAAIVARVPSLLDYVRENETAMYYESGNVEDLRAKMAKLIDDKGLCESLALNARRSIEETYNEKNMTIEIHKFIKNIL